ncbi:MAG TPA: hypothetical protein VEO01_07685 [Pseudonocardiaceae bacterium]|nr:hypothetical protein [Pseudonocardiaceae bacterium]
MAALVLLMFGGSVFAFASGGPDGLFAAGVLAFVIGVLLVGVLSYREARETGSSLPSAFWRGVRRGFRAIIDFM